MSDNTHYGLIMFGGDYDNDHPDPELRGTGPSAFFVASGDEAFCWDGLAQWTEHHPLGRDQRAEVVARDPAILALSAGDP